MNTPKLVRYDFCLSDVALYKKLSFLYLDIEILHLQ